MSNFFDSVMMLVIGLMLISFGYWLKGKEGGETLRLTQNSEFVVEKVRHDHKQWNYHFTLEKVNLTADDNLTKLIVQTDKPIGYAVGDTLKLLNHNN